MAGPLHDQPDPASRLDEDARDPFRTGSLRWPDREALLALESRPPGEGRIDVWIARVPQWAGDPSAGFLSEAEVARALAYVHEKDRVRFATARSLLRRLLAGYLGAAPGTVAIDTGRFGKPRLAGPWATSGLAFNVSCSADVMAFAFAVGADVGIDLESTAASDLQPGEAASVAGSFSTEEAALVGSLPPTDATATFLRLWVCKEACLKCLGTGLTTPLDEIEIRFRGDLRATGRRGTDAFAIHGLDAGGDVVAAVAIRGTRIREPRVVRLARG